MTTDATNTLIGMVPTVAAVGVVDSASRIGRNRSSGTKAKPRVVKIKISRMETAKAYAKESGMTVKQAYKYLWDNSAKMGRSKKNWNRW